MARKEYPRALTHLARAMLVFALITISLGAYTRLADAGLGCPDWPGCYGHWLLPLGEQAQERANAAWSENPVDIFRAAVEVAHRVAAGSLGLMILITALLSWRVHAVRWVALSALGLVVAQGLFGMWTVTLKLLPQIVSAHLLGGFTVLTALYYYYLRLSDLDKGSGVGISVPVRGVSVKLVAWIGMLLVVAQTALGGWLSANYAAIACPDFPTCQGRWLPPIDLRGAFDLTQSIGPNYLGGLLENTQRVTIHVMHRAGALLLSVYLLVAGIWIMRVADHKPIQLAIRVMLVILALQLCLGVSNILFSFPIVLAIAHNLGAALLLLSVIRVLYLLHYACLYEASYKRSQ
jgi:cytochrome c oxidase assembly protein subunit 15